MGFGANLPKSRMVLGAFVLSAMTLWLVTLWQRGFPCLGNVKGHPIKGGLCSLRQDGQIAHLIRVYSRIFDTTPAPTVRPPSRMAKRNLSSIAIGAIRVTLNFRLSPGITISVPSGSSTVPVTSVVRK